MSSTQEFDSGQTVPTSPDDAAAAEREQREERYRDLGHFAQGGMSVLHQLRDEHIGRVVAKKILRPELGSRMDQPFLDEARITGQLAHPNIIPVYDIDMQPERRELSFTMKLISGQTLLELCRELHADKRALDRPLLEHLIQVLLVVCDPIAYAHSRGVIHRDLKPENIMVGDHGQIYVVDWGIALVIGEPEDPRAGEAVSVVTARPRVRRQVPGSLAYMAPEQTTGDETKLDARTDVFGLGAILYQLLTGAPPHAGATAREVFEAAAAAQLTPPRQRRPELDLPIELCDIATRALAREPADRYASVAEFKASLGAFASAGGWLSARTFAAGETIIAEGQIGREGYEIVSGRCEVSRGHGDERVVLGVLERGELFGELAIFSGRPRSATVRALEATTVKVITREALERELGRSHWLGSLVTQLSERFLARESE